MLIFLKLGGSLITDKTRPFTPRREQIATLAAEIAAALRQAPDLRLVLGHGSGSFGHQPASQHGTRTGVASPEAWKGFAEVWYQASSLNRIVLEALHRENISAITLSPLASVTAHDGKPFIWDLYPLQTSLDQGLLPVIHGDVVFDDARGGTVLSTEELFIHLARQMSPARILLAGLEPGVWKDFPARKQLLGRIRPQDLDSLTGDLGTADGTDVTGGMHAKVTQMLALVDQIPGLEVLIFSGKEPGLVRSALLGDQPGTCLHR